MGRYLNMEDLVIDKEFEELLPVLTMEEFERAGNFTKWFA